METKNRNNEILFSPKEEVCKYMDDLMEKAINTEIPTVFSKIKDCVNIVGNHEIDLEVREVVISKIVDSFFPLLNSDQGAGEIIKVKDIDSLANKLGEIIIEHEQEDHFKEKCAHAFIETIVLYEKQ